MKFLYLLFFTLVTGSMTADVKVSSLFGDNMILQQKTSNAIWGIADSDEKVTVTASWGATESVIADKHGKWKVMLKTPGHGTDFALNIKGKNSIDIKNVAIGEVWLCAGQSNMGWAVKMCFNGEEDVAKVDLPNLRIFKSSRELWHEPLEFSRDRLAQWKTGNPQSAAETSAVSFYFAQKLQQELGIPVGIIVQAFAGTPIEGWMPKEIQMNDSRTVAGIQDLNDKSKKMTKSGITKESALKKFQQELADYNKKIDAGETRLNALKQLSPPIITKPANMGHQYPAHIFNAMINPIRPYGIKGMIWYQGERNSKDAAQALNYRKQLAQLISYYRSSWSAMSQGNVAKDFPVQVTQLPSWNPAQKNPVEGPQAVWSINREMMRLVTKDVANTTMAVSIDTGDTTQLHPKNKKPIGLRHAYLALKNTYGKNIIGSGPQLQKHTSSGNKIILEFNSIGSGLVGAKGSQLDTFAIAGEDRQWHWATAEIKGNNIILSSENVDQPVAVRYAWAMNPSTRNLLYNKEGLPASPFRTDNWPLYDPSAKVITVLKPAKAANPPTADWARPTMTQ